MRITLKSIRLAATAAAAALLLTASQPTAPALAQAPTQVTLSGSTAWDDVTWHAVTSYVALLDPRRQS